MKLSLRTPAFLALVVAVAACSSSSQGQAAPVVPLDASAHGLAAFVDPFIGTGDAVSPDPVANGLNGGTFPGAATPFGMVQFSPDTPNPSPPGYHHTDSTITGFSLTHLNGAGCPALRDLPIFPAVGLPDLSGDPSDTFDHGTEKAVPGYYQVTLGSGIEVDLTARARTGLARFVFPEGSDAHVVVSSGVREDLFSFSALGFDAKIVGNDTVTGSRDGGNFCLSDSKYRIYWAVKFDRPFESYGTESAGVTTDGSNAVSGTNSGLYFAFPTDSSREVKMKIGLSYVSTDHAQANMQAEIPDWDLDAVHRATEADWNARLGKVAVEGGDDTMKKALYTGIYHALVQPAVASDVDGSYVGFDGQTKVDTQHPRYQNFSGWDVYRSWVHLAAILAPQETSDFMRSLIEAGQACGAMPRWALANDDSGMMIGDPAAPTIAGAWAFGARDFDAKAALDLMVKSGTDPTAKCNASVARPCLLDYMTLGYCPGNDDANAIDGHVSVTEEYAIADFAVAQMAKAVGDDATHAQFLTRSGNWKNVFDTSAPGGPLPAVRNADVEGEPSFATPDPSSQTGFTEGNAAQYTFLVPQDPYGLVELLGGDDQANARLDDLFTELNAGVSRPHFYIGDEPQFATPYLYAFTGHIAKTENVVRQILTTTYSTEPGGLPGNDDLGATSAWEVWAILGLYPAVPASGTLVLGSPWFDKTTITLPSGALLTITASGATANAPYVQSLKIGGVDATRTYVTWDEISGGNTLDFVLGPNPSTTFGAGTSDRPPVPN